MVHRDTIELASIIEDYIDGHREYFLGIRGQTVFESHDPSEAAILAIAGNPR